ncbi:MAG: tRNA (adenosine(37)-N6)-dimethylallyltransferase MiaA [Patescibacteria group bacterium]
MSTPIKTRKLIIILGPTASGKSDLAVEMAKRHNGEVISADSRQVYRGMDIGTGKIPRDTTHYSLPTTHYFHKGIPHYLLDVANPKAPPTGGFTVAQYQKLARKALEDIWKRGKLPIICGGTGFYIQAVVDGLALPEVKPNPLLRKKLAEKTTDELFAMLKKKDKARAKAIDSKNRVRLIRALEIAEALGKVPKLKLQPIEADVLTFGIKKEKAELEKLILKRLIYRVEKEGMLQEISKLHKNGVSWKRLESFGLEYRYGALLLQNKISRDEFMRQLAHAINQYAKRQMTWFRRDKRILWTKNEKEALYAAKQFLKQD